MDFSRFHSVAAHELAPVFVQLREESDPEHLGAIVALFENRALGLIRGGSASQLRDEGAALNRFLYSRQGREVEAREPEISHRLKAIADLVWRAGQRTDSMFTAAVLSSHKKYAQRLVEFLWRSSSPVPRQKLLAELEIEESHLSHMLRDLENADVIARIRISGTKEVRVTLGPAGRELVQQDYMPAWFLSAMKYITDAVSGRRRVAPDEVVKKLSDERAPSRLIADHVNSLLYVIWNRSVGVQPEERAAATAR